MEDREVKELYDSETVKIMEVAEEAFVRGSNRIVELKNFARKAGINRIGIAHCVSMPEEAHKVKQYLSDEFEVYTVDCKCDKVLKHQMLGGDGTSVMCNPAGQAKFLSDHQTELNISMGLCVGHDMIFNQKSTAPVSVLIVKDRPSRHNPIESIHQIIS